MHQSNKSLKFIDSQLCWLRVNQCKLTLQYIKHLYPESAVMTSGHMSTGLIKYHRQSANQGKEIYSTKVSIH